LLPLLLVVLSGRSGGSFSVKRTAVYRSTRCCRCCCCCCCCCWRYKFWGCGISNP